MSQAWNRALSFNGISDYVEVPDNTKFDFTIEDFTLEAWINPVALAADNRIITKFVYMENGYAVNIYANGRLYFATWQDSVQQSTISSIGDIVADRWHHIVVVRSGSSCKLYINGEEVTYTQTGVHIDPTSSPANLRIGINAGWPFEGIIDEVRIYNRVLSQSEIQYAYEKCGPEDRSGLLLWLRMNEGEGVTAYDETDNDNDGTVHGATWTDGVPVCNIKVVGAKVRLKDPKRRVKMRASLR